MTPKVGVGCFVPIGCVTPIALLVVGSLVVVAIAGVHVTRKVG